ncbi:MAG: CoA-binding protein [Syntrophales bacterium]|nr:CoA-binding protein [Syntrophales bacterium]
MQRVSLSEIMEAKGVVVVGASRDEKKSGSQLLYVLKRVGFQGNFAGINPQGGEVFGLPLYKSLDEVPFQVDIAVFHVPPPVVPSVLRDCVKKGVKGVVITSEGFAETGAEGARYQNEIKEIIKESGIRGFGPNTLGIVNTDTGLTTSYFANRWMMRPGSIGFVAQSGIFVGALLRHLSSYEGLQLSKGLGLGNKVDVDESDALEYLKDDEKTKIVGMYLEDVRDGRRFIDIARQTTAVKPVLLLKGGKTEAGAARAASHTASMAVSDEVLNGALRQAGILRIPSIDELIRTLRGFLTMPQPKGPSLALVTFSGAQAIMSIDTAVEEGLTIANFNNETQQKLKQVISTPSKARNPVDIFPDMAVHGFEKTMITTLKALMEDENVHGIISISFANAGAEVYQPLAEAFSGQCSKPLFFSLLGSKKDFQECQAFLEEHGFPCFDLPEMAVRVFSRMWKYAQIKERHKRR